jgi:hypothetical protein
LNVTRHLLIPQFLHAKKPHEAIQQTEADQAE